MSAGQNGNCGSSGTHCISGWIDICTSGNRGIVTEDCVDITVNCGSVVDVNVEGSFIETNSIRLNIHIGSISY